MDDKEKKEDENRIPPIVKSLLELCKDVFEDLYGDKTNSFVAAAFQEDGNFYMAGKPLKGTSVSNNNIDTLNKYEDKLKKLVEKYRRKLDDVYYFKNLVAHGDNYSHFLLEKDIPFKFNEDGFWWATKPKEPKEEIKIFINKNLKSSYSEANNEIKVNWNALDNLEKEDTYCNDFDLFFMPKNTEKLIFIPVPILSCVSLFFILSDKNYANRIHIWEDIYNEIKYLALPRVFGGVNQKMLDPRTVVEKEEDFVKKYVDEVANIVLPLAYCIKDCTNENVSFKDDGVNCSDDNCECKRTNDCCYCVTRKNIKESKESEDEKCPYANDGELKGCIYNYGIKKDCKVKSVMRKWQPCPYKSNNAQRLNELKKGRNGNKYNCVIVLKKNEIPNLGKNYCITFFLPTFVVPYSRKLVEIQNYPRYKIAEDSFTRQIQTNFRALFENWTNMQKTKKQATQAAIAQVMARNMSHNIGSHVFSNLIGKNIYTNLNEKIATGCYGSGDVKCLVNEQVLNEQLSYFNQYMKSRMDYLSEVTFGVSNMLATKMIYNDVFKEFDRVRLLLNFIPGISDFKYEFKLMYNEKELNENNDISAAFPSDVLGCQAFYNIIENIIRNTAKHSNKGKSNELKTFTIHIKDIDNLPNNIKEYNQYYCVEIDDGIKLLSKETKEIGKDKPKLANGKITSKTEINEIDWLVTSQNFRLNASVISTRNQQVRNHSLGLMEMEASAAFLRQIDMPEIESDDYFVENNENIYNTKSNNLNIIKAFKTKDNALGYRFFIKKPQEFLFVGKWKCVNEDKKAKLMKQGIWFEKANDFLTKLNNREAYFHQFVIYEADIDNNIAKILDFTDKNDENILNYQTQLPLRRVKFESTNTEPYNDTHFKKLEEIIWRLYFNDSLKIDSTKIEIKGTVQAANTHQVVFLSHATKNGYNKEKKNITEYKKEGKIPKENKVWIENLSSNSQSKLPDFHKFATGPRPLERYVRIIGNEQAIKCKIFEAYYNKVVVVDERVQNFSNTNKEKDIESKQLFKTTNVHIPIKQLDPDAFNEKEKNIILADITKESKNAFLLIHYGILERICKDKEEINKKLKAWAKLATKVIVTSGRGQHSLELPDSVCYVNLSSMLNAFVENRNKYSINYLLNQSRSKKWIK